MKIFTVTLGVLLMMLFAMTADNQAAAEETINVSLTTSKGTIELALYPDKAPKTVANFVEYVNAGYYEGTIFHRVIKGFMIQGGGMTEEMQPKPNRKPIPIEADNGVKNLRGTIAMARTADPNSATSQFFINTTDNDFLNFKAKTPQGWGYCAFGKVTKGMEVVDLIEKVKTGTRAGHQDVPDEAVVITSAKVLP